MPHVRLLKETFRLMIRCWAGNDPLKIEAVVRRFVERESLQVIAEAVGVEAEYVKDWLTDFRSVMQGAADAEKIDVMELMEHRPLYEDGIEPEKWFSRSKGGKSSVSHGAHRRGAAGGR